MLKMILKKVIGTIGLVLFLRIFVYANPIYISFLWHMHQPVYFPYESVVTTDARGIYSFSIRDIHDQRTGPYTSWPTDAVETGAGSADTVVSNHFGTQVSFTGSLIENLNNFAADNDANFTNWTFRWVQGANYSTTLGHRRLDLVNIGYFHPIFPLIWDFDMQYQLKRHENAIVNSFGITPSHGAFLPECAFSERVIPALVKAGIKWVIVDNIHFDRACAGYPYSTDGGIIEPNRADQINPNPGNWIQLNDVWAPTRISAKFGHLPHYVEYIDPNTGAKYRIIAIPGDRYMGNEDGRGGFGALDYDNVIGQLSSYNDDPQHPLLVVLHHDGDNYGGGSDSYYHTNFQNFVNWLESEPDSFRCITIDDYLDMFPVDTNDVIHIEPGSWSGADNGGPLFDKWLSQPDNSGYSSDRASWAALVAARNFVKAAFDNDSTAANTDSALAYLFCGESSDYWYWDGTYPWDSLPSHAADRAISFASSVISADTEGPTVFLPQRRPYNPGGFEFGNPVDAIDTIWTFAFDINGISAVHLYYRIDKDGTNNPATSDNETYAGGPDVGPWSTIQMTRETVPHQGIYPQYIADYYYATISFPDSLVDYYVQAVDSQGNITKTPIQHVYFGGIANQGVNWSPQSPSFNDTITVFVYSTQAAKLHWGVNNWTLPDSCYFPPNTTVYGDSNAVETAMQGPDSLGRYFIRIGPFNNPIQSVDEIDFVIHFQDDSWDNNGGRDYRIYLGGGFIMDGQLDNNAVKIAENGGMSLYFSYQNGMIYLATNAAGDSPDTYNWDNFIFVSLSPSYMLPAPWKKSGECASFDYYLADENDNNYVSWYRRGDTAVTSGFSCASASSETGYLEGTMNALTVFGYIPESLFIAVGAYGTNDGDSLKWQVPGNGNPLNGNIDSSEYAVVKLQAVHEDVHNFDRTPLKIYPTVSRMGFHIKGTGRINIYTVSGRLVYSKNVKNSDFYWKGRDSKGINLPRGIYFIRVGSYSGKVILIK